MTDRKPTAGFWITVALVAVLVGYPLSFGPACWIASRCRKAPPTFGTRISAIGSIYWPILKIAWDARVPWDVVQRYSEIGAPQGWTISYASDLDQGYFVYLRQ
jgi:hypothetical protein